MTTLPPKSTISGLTPKKAGFHSTRSARFPGSTEIHVDPETYEVRADGELLTCQPAESLPMTQRYFLF